MTTVLTALAIVDDATRRQFLAALGAAGMLTACGGESEQADPVPATRTVRHALGTAEVPTRPSRVVVLDNSFTLGMAVSLGVVPIAAMQLEPDRERRFSSGLYPVVDDVVPLSQPDPNVEEVLAQRPDLIVAATGYIEQVYSHLQQVAPTVGIEFSYTDHWADLAALAEALGVEPARVDELRARFDERVAAIRAAVPSCGSVSVATVGFSGGPRIYAPDWGPALQALAAAGCQFVPSLDSLGAEPGETRVEVSGEQLGLLSGDRLILLQAPGSSAETPVVQETRRSELFSQLPAAMADRVLVVSRSQIGFSDGFDNLLATLDTFGEFLRR